MRALFFSRPCAALGLCFSLLAVVSFNCSSPTPPEPPRIKMRVDLSNAPQGVFHADLEIPCNTGTLTLVYPKWIPGEHAPFGPIAQLSEITFHAPGKDISWQRDPDDMYTFHCIVPESVTVLHASLDYLSPTMVTGLGYGNSPNSTGRLVTLLWNHLLLYPESESTDNVMCEPSLRLPHGWRFATAIPVQEQGNDTVTFKSTSLTRLVDSPVLAGEFLRSIPLDVENESPIFLDIAADSPEALGADSSQILLCRKVIQEADSLFGVRHFQTYHFLISLSDLLDVNGLEHHESTDIRLPERAFLDKDIWKRRSYLIPHEYIHSWNGKFKRPLGLAAFTFQEPLQSELLWIYEGLTRYLDVILTGRSGLRTQEEVRDYIAWEAGYLDRNRPGRSWRSLEDASTSARLLYPAPDEWSAWRRGAFDIYDEGALIWLEADATIRELSGGQRSLDDFCRSFYVREKGQSGEVVTYALEDVAEALDRIAHYDWEKFFSDRVTGHNTHPPLGGITRTGWELVYSDSANSQVALREKLEHRVDASWSIGASVFEDGLVQDVVPGSACSRAGMTPGMKILKVNGQSWSLQALRGALRQAKTSRRAIDLIVQQGRRQLRPHLEYYDGEQYPRLRRVEGKADVLEKILASRAR